MPGRRPIFATLISNIYYKLRDTLYKATLEPEAPEIRKAKESFDSKSQKKAEEKKPW